MPASTGDSTLHDEPDRGDVSEHPEGLLFVIASPDRSLVGKRFELSTEPFLLGRRIERGGVAVNDPRMSRVHARIAWDGRACRFRVGDAGSANGTFVDGQPASAAPLHEGSVIRTGATISIFTRRDPVAELEERIDKVSTSELSVLVLGETGTGKELLARRLHEQSGRRGRFVAVNCAALPRELLTSELFGHVRGAFSGARDEREGLFRSAEGGSLFLDEIGDLPLELQPALLRAIQERTVRPVGGEREVPVDVRVMAATHHDLGALVEAGTFRLDLHARLAEVELRVPALRERRHTLPALLEVLARAHGLDDFSVTADAMERLARGHFPQNIRQLKSLLGRLKVFGAPPFALTLEFLRREAPDLFEALPLRDQRDTKLVSGAPPPAVSREALMHALSRHGHRVADVARELGTSRTQIYRWLKRFGLETPSGRS